MGTADLARILLIAATLCVVARAQGIFGPIDEVQLKTLLSDRGYVVRQIGCVLGRNKCDKTGNQLKVAIPEVLVRQCRSCSPQQAENARRVMNFIQYNYPQEWSQIVSKYRRRT